MLMTCFIQADDGSEEDYDDFWADYADYSDDEEETNLVSSPSLLPPTITDIFFDPHNITQYFGFWYIISSIM